jgi:hypothetical protein
MVKYTVNPSIAAILKYYSKIFKVDIDPRIFANIDKRQILTDSDEHLLDILESHTDIVVSAKRMKLKRDFILELTDYPYRELSYQALQVYGFIKHRKIEFNTDRIMLKAEDIQEYLGHKTTKSAYKILKELCMKQIIYNSDINGVYFINLVIVFKGSLTKILLGVLKRHNLIKDNITELSIDYVRGLEKTLENELITPSSKG